MKSVNLKAVFLQISLFIGLLIFGRGFLPPNRTETGLNTELHNVTNKFDRVVFMVVDAMRSDFLFSDKSHMKGCHELLRYGKGYAFTAFSDPPTVTLPRLKGLTTGSSSNFLDAVINVAESDSASILHNQDSWIHQLHSQGKRMHMFGDDTWLKLFPNMFNKTEGTASFYVADFTEVDNNVTRHLDTELGSPSSAPSWDILILHYLGLDHIGHKGGPNSPHMPAKQEEMDRIATQIYDSLDESTLFVLAGDHGMNDVGNHGGASEGETSAALAFFAKRFNNRYERVPLPSSSHYSFYSKVYQVDLVPSLAMLLGFPIPKNSLGVFINDLLPLWPIEEQNQILQANCAHLDISTEKCNWQSLRDQQRHLMKTTSDYIFSYMISGILILAVVTLVTILFLYKILLVTDAKQCILTTWWLVLPLLYFIGMMGSSTVEEEHYIWYWSLTGLLASLVVYFPDTKSKLNVALLLICFRIMRGWNTAGQKWAAMLDGADIIAAYPFVKRSLVVVVLVCVASFSRTKFYKDVFLLLTLTSFGVFKIYSDLVPVSLWWMVWLPRIGALSGIIDVLLYRNLGTNCVLFLLIQTRIENILLWLVFYIARDALVSLKNSSDKFNSEGIKLALSLVGMCFEYSSFFIIGGSNSLASIDLSNAYNGVSSYNIPLVAALTYLGNWGPSLYFSSLVFSKHQRLFRAYFYGISVLSVTLACYILREHLFIWTVFSPKLLYVAAWLLFHEILATNLATISY